MFFGRRRRMVWETPSMRTEHAPPIKQHDAADTLVAGQVGSIIKVMPDPDHTKSLMMRMTEAQQFFCRLSPDMPLLEGACHVGSDEAGKEKRGIFNEVPMTSCFEEQGNFRKRPRHGSLTQRGKNESRSAFVLPSAKMSHSEKSRLFRNVLHVTFRPSPSSPWP